VCAIVRRQEVLLDRSKDLASVGLEESALHAL
jgi:hypothetical protein